MQPYLQLWRHAAERKRASKLESGLRFVHSLIRRAGLSVRPTLKNEEFGVLRSTMSCSPMMRRTDGLTSQLVSVQISGRLLGSQRALHGDAQYCLRLLSQMSWYKVSWLDLSLRSMGESRDSPEYRIYTSLPIQLNPG